MAYFGDLNPNSGTSNNIQEPPANFKAASKFSLTFNASVSTIFIDYKATAIGFAANSKNKAIIYADSGGVPGAFIAQSAEVLGSGSNQLNVTIAYTFSPAVNLTAAGGPYWLGIWSDTQSQSFCQVLASGIDFNAQAYSTGGSPSNPFGTSNTPANGQYPILAKYTPVLTAGSYSGETVGMTDSTILTYSSNALRVARVDATYGTGSEISSVTFFLSAGVPAAKVKAVLYADDGAAGAPGTLLGSSAELVGPVIGPNTLSLVGGPINFTGRPYIGVFCDTNLSTYFLVDAGRASFTVASTYTSGVPGSFPGGSSSTTSQPALWANGAFVAPGATLGPPRPGERFWADIADPEPDPQWAPRKYPAIAPAPVVSAAVPSRVQEKLWAAIAEPELEPEWLPRRYPAIAPAGASPGAAVERPARFRFDTADYGGDEIVLPYRRFAFPHTEATPLAAHLRHLWSIPETDAAHEWQPPRRAHIMQHGVAGAGGKYGGGGGGSGATNPLPGGSGTDGLIIITYTPLG